MTAAAPSVMSENPSAAGPVITAPESSRECINIVTFNQYFLRVMPTMQVTWTKNGAFCQVGLLR